MDLLGDDQLECLSREQLLAQLKLTQGELANKVCAPRLRVGAHAQAHAHAAAHVLPAPAALPSWPADAQRELLARSFEQLRRTQERLGRRERRLAREQVKCRQLQSVALAAWQAALAPMVPAGADPAAREMVTAQMQAFMAAAAAAAAGAVAEPAQQAAELQQTAGRGHDD